MLEIFKRAITAAQQENWSLVSQCLQQLLLETKGEKLLPLDELEGQEALRLGLQVLKAGDFPQKWEVTKVFPKLGKRAIAPLIEILEKEATEPEICWFAARILSQFDDPACIIALVKLLQQTEDEELAAIASQALANIGNSAIEALSSLIEENNSRTLAVQALAQIRRSEIIEPLLKVVDDPLPEIRATAIEALGSFHEERILPVLLKALQDPAAKVRKEAVIALGMRTEARSQFQLVDQLKPLLYDFNEEVCQQAALSLGRMGTDDAAEALFPILKSPATHLWLKLILVRALSWIETVRALNYLQEALRWGDVPVCQEIVTVLGRERLPDLKVKATQILSEFFHSGQSALQQPQIRQALAMSFGELGAKEAMQPLLELEKDSDRTVRLHAIAALKKFSITPNSC